MVEKIEVGTLEPGRHLSLPLIVLLFFFLDLMISLLLEIFLLFIF